MTRRHVLSEEEMHMIYMARMHWANHWRGNQFKPSIEFKYSESGFRMLGWRCSICDGRNDWRVPL